MATTATATATVCEEAFGQHTALVRQVLAECYGEAGGHRALLRRVCIAMRADPDVRKAAPPVAERWAYDDGKRLVAAALDPDRGTRKRLRSGAAASSPPPPVTHSCPRCHVEGATCAFVESAQSQMGRCPSLAVGVWHCVRCGAFRNE